MTVARAASRDHLMSFLRADAGSTSLDPALVSTLSRISIVAVVLGANVVGAVIALLLALAVIPLPSGGRVPWPVAVATVTGYLVVAGWIGVTAGAPRSLGIREWLLTGLEPTTRIRHVILALPARVFVVQMTLWLVAALGAGVLEGIGSGERGGWVALIVGLAGTTTAAFSYLLTERLARPLAMRALAGADPDLLPSGRGVAMRSTLAWALGSGIPAAGAFVLGVRALFPSVVTLHGLAVAIVVLAGTVLLIGLSSIYLAARASADPIESVVRALSEVGEGNLDVRIPVYDGTEIGRLQAGFNDMVAGLAERERIRAVLGTYVDPAVAEHILQEGTDMAGEEVEVSMMFVDIRNFTAFAQDTPATEVVSTINRLFERAVPIIRDHGGHVDKFVGDGLLAIFGAPRRTPDHADLAVAAATQIASAVLDEFAGALSVGIGVNTGVAVAGNVGGAGRFEFSVIGDAVNVAARIESATRQTGDTILISERTRALLRQPPAVLIERPGIALKGKSGTASLFSVGT